MIGKPSKELFPVFHLIPKKAYDLNSEIGLKRYQTFKANLKIIKDTNQKDLTYKLGINQFADLTKEEFTLQHLVDRSFLQKRIKGFLSGRKSNIVPNVSKQVRNPIDWSQSFQAARDQGDCGGCWAFATAGASEAIWWNDNQSKNKIYMSTQQLLDCDRINNIGCEGGWFDEAFNYVKTVGLVEDKNYPFSGYDGTCSIPAFAPIHKISGVIYCEECNIDTWYYLLARGPIAVAVDATDFQLYNGGIVRLTGCGPLNHAVIAIGWNKDQNGEYIIVRNSWGTFWGENGNIRIYFTASDNTCGLNNYAYLPVIEGNLPPAQTGNSHPAQASSECFKPTTPFIFKNEWKLTSAFNGLIEFKGIGIDFQIATFDKQNGTISYNIKIAGWGNTSTKIAFDTNFKKIVCQWDFSIDPLIETRYSINFSSDSGLIILIVNGISFTCKNNKNLETANYFAFAGNANSEVKICNAVISANIK